jgi:hypothetical protein
MELAGVSQAAAAMRRQAAVVPVLVPGVVNVRRRRGDGQGRVGVEHGGVLRPGFVVRAASSEEHGVTVSEADGGLVQLLEKRQDATGIEEVGEEIGGFSGLGVSEVPVTICQARTLDPVLSLSDALPVLEGALNDLEKRAPSSRSGIIRFQVLTLLLALRKWFLAMALMVVI